MTKEKLMRLDAIREEIDTLDEKILYLLQNRFKSVEEIRELKNTLGLPVGDKKREEEVLNNLLPIGEKLGLSKSFVAKLFKLIISESKKIQGK